MGNGRTQRAFRPRLDGLRLEDRLVLDATVAAQVGTIAATDLAVDPLVQPTAATFKPGYLTETAKRLQLAYQAFTKSFNQAAQRDIKALGNGQGEGSLIASLTAYTSLQGGILEGKVQQVAHRLPGGQLYLFAPPQGPVPGGYPTNGATGPDIRYFVPPPQRLMTQVETMLATLQANATSLQSAVGPASTQAIRQASMNSHAALAQFIRDSETLGIINLKHGG